MIHPNSVYDGMLVRRVDSFRCVGAPLFSLAILCKPLGMIVRILIYVVSDIPALFFDTLRYVVFLFFSPMFFHVHQESVCATSKFPSIDSLAQDLSLYVALVSVASFSIDPPYSSLFWTVIWPSLDHELMHRNDIVSAQVP